MKRIFLDVALMIFLTACAGKSVETDVVTEMEISDDDRTTETKDNKDEKEALVGSMSILWTKI